MGNQSYFPKLLLLLAWFQLATVQRRIHVSPEVVTVEISMRGMFVVCVNWIRQPMLALCICISLLIHPVLSLGCYRCKSLMTGNGSQLEALGDRNCQDPFENVDVTMYKFNCFAPLHDRNGVFPGQYCIKINGVNAEHNQSLVVRDCAVKNMQNMCGQFRFKGKLWSGCILSCKTDGCNAANRTTDSSWISLATLCVLSFGLLHFHTRKLFG